ncbi:MAG: prepilin-type N-terminal cleavage/methylation domain-containing protein [Verrucomicrobiales bacterium]
MKTQFTRSAARAGYTLVEVAVASTVLLIAVGAACTLSLTMITQEEMHVRVSRAVNLMENATRLYQLGIDTELPTGSTDATVFSLLPPDPMVSSFTATAQSRPAMTGIGAPEQVSFSLTFYPTADPSVWQPATTGFSGTWGGRPDTTITGNSDTRTIGPLKVIRPSID